MKIKNGRRIQIECNSSDKEWEKRWIAYDPKKCKICMEKEGSEIAEGLIICPDCERIYW